MGPGVGTAPGLIGKPQLCSFCTVLWCHLLANFGEAVRIASNAEPPTVFQLLLEALMM